MPQTTSPETLTPLKGWGECGGVQVAFHMLKRAPWLLGTIDVERLAIKVPVARYMNCLRPSVVGDIAGIPRAECWLTFQTIGRHSAYVNLRSRDPQATLLGRPLLGHMPATGKANSHFGDPLSCERNYVGFSAYVYAEDGQAMMMGHTENGNDKVLQNVLPNEVVSFIGSCHLAYKRYQPSHSTC